MKQEKITAKVPKLDTEVEAEFSFPESLQEAIEWCGESNILDNAKANYKVVIQAAMRRLKIQGKTNKEIQEFINQMKMGSTGPRVAVDPIQAAAAKFAMMTPEEQAQYIQSLKALQGKKK